MTKVVIGMSGGVDSAVAAARAVEAGHEVVGVREGWRGMVDRKRPWEKHTKKTR